MGRLFIIGNGFDIAHGYATRYTDFKTWLESELPPANPKIRDIAFIPVYKGNEWENKDLGDITYRRALIRFLLSLFDRFRITGQDFWWYNFEEALLHLNIEFFHDAQTEDIITEEDGITPDYVESLSRRNSDNLYYALKQLPLLFLEWIKTVKIEQSQIPFGKQYIDDKRHRGFDFYINFNYTETLEQNYNIPPDNVLHIHGYRKKEEPIIIGYDNSETRDIMLSSFGGEYEYAHSRLQEALALLQKKTDDIIYHHKPFFEMLSKIQIDEIFSFGFSFSKVDIPYIREIVAAIHYGEGTIWRLYCYNISDLPRFKTAIRDCGFKGDISVLS